MIHYMNLASEPFEQIKSGAKTIELRLYDEKRQNVSEGDNIIFTNLTDKRQIVVIVPHYKNKPVVFHSQLSVEYTEQERKYLSECRLENNIIKTISDRICDFEKPQTSFGPAMFRSFHLILNAKECANAKEKDRLDISDYETEQSIIRTLPCWHVAGSTVTTLSRDHLPLINWTGPCYDFILDYQGKKVNYVKRTR